jgi:hypothetical protein
MGRSSVGFHLREEMVKKGAGKSQKWCRLSPRKAAFSLHPMAKCALSTSLTEIPGDAKAQRSGVRTLRQNAWPQPWRHSARLRCGDLHGPHQVPRVDRRQVRAAGRKRFERCELKVPVEPRRGEAEAERRRKADAMVLGIPDTYLPLLLLPAAGNSDPVAPHTPRARSEGTGSDHGDYACNTYVRAFATWGPPRFLRDCAPTCRKRLDCARAD